MQRCNNQDQGEKVIQQREGKEKVGMEKKKSKTIPSSSTPKG